MTAKKLTFLDVGEIDRGRPAGRPPKTNKKVEFMKKVLRGTQYVAPRWTAKQIWMEFTRAAKTPWREAQKEMVKSATITPLTYRDKTIYHYRWGKLGGPTVLLVHGWRSKIIDFRRLIQALVNEGYVVEGIDMPAHGDSEGTHSALPEFYDVLNTYASSGAPYHAVIGYSLGGLAAGLWTANLPKEKKPQQLVFLAAPPYARYFFEDIVNDLKLNQRVYHKFCGMVEEHYGASIDFFDLREQLHKLENISLHLAYDEVDETVPFDRGQSLWNQLPHATFLHGKGLGHYKIISHFDVISYVIERLSEETLVPLEERG